MAKAVITSFVSAVALIGVAFMMSPTGVLSSERGCSSAYGICSTASTTLPR